MGCISVHFIQDMLEEGLIGFYYIIMNAHAYQFFTLLKKYVIKTGMF